MRLSCYPSMREVPIETAALGMTNVGQDMGGSTRAPGGNGGNSGNNNNLARYIHVDVALIYRGRHCCSIHQSQNGGDPGWLFRGCADYHMLVCSDGIWGKGLMELQGPDRFCLLKCRNISLA
jgi:hypothetical protein